MVLGLKRAFASLVGVWFLASAVAGDSLHRCPLHAASHGASPALMQHGAHSTHQAPSKHQSCTCPGDCCPPSTATPPARVAVSESEDVLVEQPAFATPNGPDLPVAARLQFTRGPPGLVDRNL